jgi:GNAT superfamily N-acetyltransferase
MPRIAIVETADELRACFALRYAVWKQLGYLETENADGLEIDAFDRRATSFAVFEGGRAIATLRLVGENEPWMLAAEVLDDVADARLRARALGPCRRRLPSMTTEHIARLVEARRAPGQLLAELSRSVVHPDHRGRGLLRALIELGLARAMRAGRPLLVGSCVEGHVPLYARFGFAPLPGAGAALNDTVGTVGVTLYRDTRRHSEITLEVHP